MPRMLLRLALVTAANVALVRVFSDLGTRPAARNRGRSARRQSRAPGICATPARWRGPLRAPARSSWSQSCQVA